MKRIIVISFLVLFIMQCGIKTIIVAAFYAQRDYISTTRCENKQRPKMHCNGKCYLNKQLKKEQEHENDLPGILKTTTEVFVSNQTAAITFVNFEITVQPYYHYLISPYQKNILPVFRPPLVTT